VDNNITKTLVIPAYTVSSVLETMACRCALSHRKQVDQIIITEDGGFYSEKLREVADIYIYNKQNAGFTKNLNKGWKLSISNFTILANSDTLLVEGNLDDLCKTPPMVCSPKIINSIKTNNGFTGSYFIVPEEIRQRFGLLDERLKTFQSDIQYYNKIKAHFIREKRVSVFHYKSQSIIQSGLDSKKELTRDSNIYNQLKKQSP